MDGRILGLDYGSKTVGVALSDPLGLTAQGLTTLRREKENHLRATLRRIEEIIEEYHVTKIVLGNPLMPDGTVGERAYATGAFRDTLAARTALPVLLWDERLTSVEAEALLSEAGVPAREKKMQVDRIAAQLILQDYLNSNRSDKRSGE